MDLFDDLLRGLRWWQHFVVSALPVRGTIGMSYLRRAGEKTEEEFICSLSPDLSVPMMFSLLKRYWGTGWWLWGLLPLHVGLTVFLSFSAKRVLRTGECFMFAFTLACYTPLLCCSMSAVNRMGQQVLMRCSTDHTTLQLLALCCVCPHGHWPQTHSLKPVCAISAKATRVLGGIVHVIMKLLLDYISLVFACFLLHNLD